MLADGDNIYFIQCYLQREQRKAVGVFDAFLF